MLLSLSNLKPMCRSGFDELFMTTDAEKYLFVLNGLWASRGKGAHAIKSLQLQ